MSVKGRLQPPDVAAIVGIGAACAVVFGVMLAGLSAPKGFDERVTQLQQQATRAQGLLRAPRDAGPFGADALCLRDPSQQAQTLHDLVSGQASGSGLVLDSLDARVEPAPEVSTRVTPVRVSFSVTGSYESAVGLLALLARERPKLFLDSLDLTPKVSNVTLSVSGRVFCGA